MSLLGKEFAKETQHNQNFFKSFQRKPLSSIGKIANTMKIRPFIFTGEALWSSWKEWENKKLPNEKV